MPHVTILELCEGWRGGWAAYEVLNPFFEFRRAASLCRKSVLCPAAATTSSGKTSRKTGRKVERRKEATRRKNRSDQAFGEDRRARDQIHGNGRHDSLEAGRRHTQSQHLLPRGLQGLR